MKTAIQELIEEFIQELKNGENSFSVDEKYLLKWVITEAEYKLEKEKEQIIDFGYKCRNKCKKDSTLLPQDIFNQTYNQNK